LTLEAFIDVVSFANIFCSGLPRILEEYQYGMVYLTDTSKPNSYPSVRQGNAGHLSIFLEAKTHIGVSHPYDYCNHQF
jgi:hypothetical protein